MSEWRGRRCLVVGGAGFVGSNLVSALSAAGADVVIVDNLLSSDPGPALCLPGVEFVEGSISDDAVLSGVADAFDTVFHLATYHGNQSSIADPIADHENNTLTTLKLFERLSSFRNLRRVVYSSAGCTVAAKTFDDPLPTKEEDPVSLHLDSPYQISKVVGEMYANYFHDRVGLPVVIARFQNVYGPGEILGAGRWRGTPETVWRNVTPTFIYRALRHLPLLLENEGASTRDFIYVDDVVRGLILCAEVGRPGEVYNLATGLETTILELAETVNRFVSPPTPIELRPRRDWDHSGRRLGSTVKAAEALGYRATIGLHDGVGATVAWTVANLPTIESSIQRHREQLANVGAPLPIGVAS